MADGTTGKYATNANSAASGAPQCTIGGCSSCVKAGLPLLLVRPGLADAAYAAAQHGNISPLLPGVADPRVSYSGYVMRTLRRGYVYAYYEKAHTPQIKAQGGWQVFEVDDGGYLTPRALTTASVANAEEFSCKRTDGYAAAMLFVIPDAKHTARVWIGFSDYPWSKKVRDFYVANVSARSQRMACINAASASCDRSVQLTAENLNKVVSDYATGVPAKAFAGNPFPRRTTAEESSSIAKSLSLISQLLPQNTTRKESAADVWQQAKAIVDRAMGTADIQQAKIISLPDAIGVTHEAAQLRITLCNEAANWLSQQQDGYWRLQTALSIDGLLKLADARGEQSKASVSDKKYSGLQDKLVSTKEFEAMKKSGQLPAEAELADYYTQSPTVGAVKSYGVGTIDIPSARQIDKKTGDLKSEVLNSLSNNGPGGTSYKQFMDSFYDKAKADRERLSKVEKDYQAWLPSPARKLVTEHDFDDGTPQDGVYYAGAVAMVTFGGPLTDTSLGWFKDFLQEDPGQKDNLLVRAMLGNQQAFFGWFKELDQKSKTTDEVKALFDVIGELEEAQHHAGSSTSAAQAMLYRSIPALRNLVSAYANPLITVAGATSMALNKAAQLTPALVAKLVPLAQAVAVKSANNAGLALLKVQVPLRLASRVWRNQMGAVQQAAQAVAGTLEGRQVKSLVIGGAMAVDMAGSPKLADTLVDIYLWTKELPDKVGSAAGKAEALPGKAASAINNAGKTAAAAVTTYALRPAEVNLSKAWATAVRYLDEKGITAAARGSTQLLASGTATMTLASGWLQCLVIAKSWKEYQNAVGEDRQKAAFSLLSAGLGVAAAALELGKVFAEKASAEAVIKRLAWGIGVAAGLASIIDSAQAVINTSSEYSKGSKSAAAAYGFQAFFFFGAAGMAAAGGAYAAGAITAAGWGLSWTGWGLLLVALGMAAGFIAILLDDTPIEEWTKRCIWSNEAPDKWGSLKREQEELNKIIIGVRIDFSFSAAPLTLRNLAASGAIADGAEALDFVAEARLRVVIPEALRESIRWETSLNAQGSSEQRKLWITRPGEPGQASALIGGPSFSYKKTDEEGAILEVVQISSSAVSAITAHVTIYDAPVEGDVIVNEDLK